MFTSFINETTSFNDHLDRDYMKYANEMVSNEKLRFLASNRAIRRQMMELSEDSHNGAIKVERDQISEILIALDAHHLIIEERMNELSNVLTRKMERNMEMRHKHRDGMHKIAKRFNLSDHSVVKRENEDRSMDQIYEWNNGALKFETDLKLNGDAVVANTNKMDDEMTEFEDNGIPRDVASLNEVDAQNNGIPMDQEMESWSKQSDVEDISGKTDEVPSPHKPYEKGINLKCGECDKLFHFHVDFVNHMKIKHDVDKPYECHQCGYSSKIKSKLLRHLADVHQMGVKYRCGICSKGFGEEANLVAHLRVHTGERPFQCTVCRKNFKHQSHLTVHERVHNGDRPYECTVCSKRFTQHVNLIRHERIHNEERPYTCSICGKTFRQKIHLTVHERVHSGEKPYECTVCSKRCTTKSNLVSHQRVHSGEKPYECSKCHKAYKQSGHLRRHEKNCKY